MTNNFLRVYTELIKRVELILEKIPMGSQLFPQIATIVAVNDPKNKGRVKVTYDNATTEISEWVELIGSHSGNLPAQYIGTRMLALFLNGNAEDAVLTGTLLTDLDQPVISAPVVVPIVDEQTNEKPPECNEALEGHLMMFSSTISTDLKICIRRNSVTADINDPKVLKSIYSWKSITNSLAILKGEYGDLREDASIKKGIKKCSPELEGEIGLFTEDRALRQIQMICRKMPGGVYAWINQNSPMVYTRTLLPACNNQSHGLEVVIDDGLNSELATCLRRDKQLMWLTASQKKLGFHPETPPAVAFIENFAENPPAPVPEKYEELALNGISFSSFGNISGSIQNIANTVSDIINTVQNIFS